jgi:peptide/nickel transport system substrate-binding protein
VKLKRYSLSVVAVCAIALGASACTSSSPSSPSSTSSSTSGGSAVLTMEGQPTGPISRDFNPFSETSASSLDYSASMTYEPLYQYDVAKGNVMYPWLATHYAWSNGGRTVTFTIRSGVKFSNGTPFSAADVAFTFNLLKKYPAINLDGLPIAGASAPSATTAVINFTSPVYSELYYIAGETYIVPESIWSKVGNPSTYADPDPIGTGPYVLSTYSPTGLTYTKNPNYWQKGLPKVATVDFPVYDSNVTANLALDSGSLVWAGNYVSNIVKDYLDVSSSNHYWTPALYTDAMVVNNATFPFNSLAVRQAVSEGIDRTALSQDGEEGMLPPATDPGALTGLTLPLQNSYLTSQTKNDDTTYSTSACKATLEKAGWKMGSDNFFTSPSGKQLAFTLISPASATDAITDDGIISGELASCGMNVNITGETFPSYAAAKADGSFQAELDAGTAGPTPYFDYNNYLNDTLSAPVGKNATGDFGRFYNAQAQTYLNSYASTNSTETQQADILGIEKIVATQLPIIPLYYGVSWDEYSTAHFTGFASASNPYAPGGPQSPWNEITLLHLKPVS